MSGLRDCTHARAFSAKRVDGLTIAPTEHAHLHKGQSSMATLVELGSFIYVDWKAQRFCWPKGTSLECAESKTTGAVCGNEELCRWKKKKKMDKS